MLIGLGIAACGADATPEEELVSRDNAITGVDACTSTTSCSTAKELGKTSDCTFFVGFDGSGVYSPDVNSNVGVLYKETRGPAALGGAKGLNGEVVRKDTRRVYVEGVPSVVGNAAAERVDRGRNAVCQHLKLHGTNACDIVLVGYSRGAIIANQVARALDQVGCTDGSHRGTRIKLLGAFDPVKAQMGSDWGDLAWSTEVPSNVDSFIQIYKSTLEDPRGFSGLFLTTTPMTAPSARSACTKSLGRRVHPNGRDWHHGEIGHLDLPRDAMKCALEMAHVDR